MKGSAFKKMDNLALLCVLAAVVRTQENNAPAEVLTPSDFNIAKGRSVSSVYVRRIFTMIKGPMKLRILIL